MNFWDQLELICRVRENSSVTVKYLYYKSILEVFVKSHNNL